MKKTLRVLVVEDSDDDAELLLRYLRRGEYAIDHHRVQTPECMREALAGQAFDLIICDYAMPRFSAPEALAVLKDSGLDLPFLIVSGTIGEENAVEALKAGAHDFLVKGRLARLFPAIERELREAESRRRRRDMEERLRASEENFRTLVESMDEIVFTIDRRGRYLGMFSDRFEREGFKREDFIGKTAGDFFGSDTTANARDEAYARAFAGQPSTYETSIERGDGVRHFQISLSPRRDGEGEVIGLVGVCREVTEQKRVQAQLAVSDRMASVGMLAAALAHEINNPLAAVLANLELGSRALDELGPASCLPQGLRSLVDELRDARESGERIRDIVRDLRFFSRSEDEERVPVQLEHVLDSTIRMAWNEIRHRARLVKHYSPVPPVLAIESRLGQVFLNLIVNAAQAIPAGNALENEIAIALAVGSDGQVVAEVRDTGSGMSPEVVRRLFTPFFTTKPVGMGTGLGLSICHRIISAFGGQISVESEIGKGSTFRVSLPPTQATVVRDAEAPAAPPRLRKRGRVLIVDDEPMVATALCRILSDEHETCALQRASDALARIASGERFDVILCDLMMPDVTGMDFFARLLRMDEQQAERVVFLTGGAFTPRVQQFLDEVPNPRIEKPFDVRTVRAVIGNHMR